MRSVLFTPFRIGTLEVPNRLARSATGEGMCTISGKVTPLLVDFYRDLARGGAGLIVTGHAFERRDGKASEGMMGVHDDKMLPGLSALAAAVHESDARVVCQLNHAGRQTRPERIGDLTPVAPSAVLDRSSDLTPRALRADEMDGLLDSYVEAAARAREAGFDGVQLHAAHGYLMSQFLSPYTNRRDDLWGGSLEGRARFPCEALRRIRAALGTELPVLVKLNAEDFIEGGLTVAESVQIAARLEAGGVDAIEISAGMAETVEQILRKDIVRERDEAYFVDYCRAFRQQVAVPLVCVGGLRSKVVMESVIGSGAADLVSLSRPLIREPDLPARLRDGRADRARCVSCNGCTRGPDGRLGCALDFGAATA